MYVDELIDSKLDYLREQSLVTLNSRGKCYPYGCFQALLLSRLFPGWQEGFFKDQKLLDQVIGEKLAMSDEERGKIAGDLKTRYEYEEIVKRKTERINNRDAAIEVIRGRQGRTYIINFKPVREYLTPKWRGESFSVGLMVIAPDGLESMAIRDITLEGKATPIMQDQLYYIKWVDTETPLDIKGYSLEFSGKEGEDVFLDAVFRTKGFLLKAPKIQIRERAGRTKVSVLAKIKD